MKTKKTDPKKNKWLTFNDISYKNDKEIKKENDVVFYVYENDRLNFNKTQFEKINFSLVNINLSECYDGRNNIFTVPCDGVYFFNAGARISGIETDYVGLGLFVNNKLHTMMDFKTSLGGLLSLHGTASIYLLKKDIVDLRCISTSNANCYLFGKTIGSFVWFSGSLVFKD